MLQNIEVVVKSKKVGLIKKICILFVMAIVSYRVAAQDSIYETEIIYISGNFEYNVLFINNGEYTQLTHDTNIHFQLRTPRWSPDASQIAFTDSNDIYIMDSDGSNLTQLTRETDIFDYYIDWSPEGNKIAIAVGAPSRNHSKHGKDLFNSAYFIEDGKVKNIAHKTLLPTYDVFDEYRYFEPNHTFDLVEFKGKKLAITICEDIWDTGEINPLYKINPVAELAKLQPDILFNLSASPFNYNQAKNRIDVVRKNATAFNLPVFYCNCVGAQTELIVDCVSVVMNANGEVIDEMPYF